MSFMPDEIEVMKQIAANLEKCAAIMGQQIVIKDNKEVLQKDALNNIYRALCLHLTVSDIPIKQSVDILLRLSWDKPEIAKRIEEQYYDIVSYAPINWQKFDEAKQLTEIFRLQVKTKELAEAFRVYAEMAQRDVTTEKPAGTKQVGRSEGENGRRNYIDELVRTVIKQRDILITAINEHPPESSERYEAVQRVSPRYIELPDMWSYAIKQASEIGQLSVLAPLIENLQKAHKDFIDISGECANTSGQLANALENHCKATNRLINYLPAVESASLIARTTSVPPGAGQSQLSETTPKFKIEKISAIIKKLESLKETKEEYDAYHEEHSKAHLGFGPDSTEKVLGDNDQQQIDEIELDLVEVEDCIADYTKPENGFGGWVIPTGTFSQNLNRDIKYAIKSRNPEPLHTLIQHLKKVKRRLEIKAQEKQGEELVKHKPAGTEKDTEGHKDFFTRIANSVHELVRYPANKQLFQKQLNAFRKAIEKFDGALKKAREAAVADPKLRYDYDENDEKAEPPKPPKENYEVERHYVLDTPPKAFWRPRLPFSPEGYLRRFECKWLSVAHPTPDEPRNTVQKVMCEFALLAAIRDEALEITACDRLTNIEKDDWVESLWRDVSHEGATYDDIVAREYRKRNINTAFEDVKADLLKKPADAAQAQESTEKSQQWSRVMTKQDITTALGLTSVYKLNKLASEEIYILRQVGEKRTNWQIFLDGLSLSHQKKLS